MGRYNCGGWFVEVINDSIVQCYSTIETHLLENGYIKVLWGRQTVFIKNKY